MKTLRFFIAFLLLTPLLAWAQNPVKNLTAQQAAQLVQTDKNMIVLDVRTPAEYQEGHLKNAVNVDYKAADFEQQLAKLDRSKSYLVHCAVGGRSTKTLPMLQKLGFQHVQHLDGGLQAWQQAGLPLVK